MHQSEGALAVGLVLALVDVLHDQHVVLNLQSVSVKLLAAHIANADVNVCTARRVRDAANQLWLTIKEDKLDFSLHVVESDTAHSTPMTDVLLREIDGGEWVGKARPD